MGKSAGNATAAARQAGYSAKTAASIGSRLLRKVNIQEALAARIAADPQVATRKQRQEFWTAVMSGRWPFTRVSTIDRLRASQLLGKAQGDFIKRHEHAGPSGGPIPIAETGRVVIVELPDNGRPSNRSAVTSSVATEPT